MIAAPLLAPILSKWLGFGPALMLAGGISIIGFIFFVLERSQPISEEDVLV
jgi:dipeptide/tripeptide permease